MGEILIDNEASIKRLAEISVGFAQAGADIVAPSDMMDGRISAIKAGLNECGLGNKVWLRLSIIHCLDKIIMNSYCNLIQYIYINSNR